jgi:hypothetical protein
VLVGCFNVMAWRAIALRRHLSLTRPAAAAPRCCSHDVRGAPVQADASGPIFNLHRCDDWRDVHADVPKGFDDVKQVRCAGGLVPVVCV